MPKCCSELQALTVYFDSEIALVFQTMAAKISLASGAGVSGGTGIMSMADPMYYFYIN